MAEIDDLQDIVFLSSESTVVRDAGKLLRDYGLTVESPSPASDMGADLIVTVPSSTGASPRKLLCEYKTTVSGEYIPSSIVASTAAYLSGLREHLGLERASYYLCTNRKLGSGARSLSSDFDIRVIPEVSTGQQLAQEILQIVSAEQEGS